MTDNPVPAEPETAHELVEQMTKAAELSVYTGNPAELTDDQIRELIELERSRRAQFIEAKN